MLTHVAIIFEGTTYSLPKPNRHHDVIRLIVEKTGVSHVDDDEQGFLDDTGKFYGRCEALKHAIENKQLKGDSRAAFALGMLFSEDIW
jgi:hypothetical protein